MKIKDMKREIELRRDWYNYAGAAFNMKKHGQFMQRLYAYIDSNYHIDRFSVVTRFLQTLAKENHIILPAYSGAEGREAAELYAEEIFFNHKQKHSMRVE